MPSSHRAPCPFRCVVGWAPLLDAVLLERPYQVGDAGLEAGPFHAQHHGGCVVVVPEVLAGGGRPSARDVPGGQLALPGQVGKRGPGNLGHVAVREPAPDGEVAPPAGLGPLHGADVRQRRVAHVDPDGDGARRGDPAVPGAGDEGRGALVGRVDALEGGEVVRDGAEHDRRADGGQVEAGLLAGHKVPRRLLGQRLGEPVRRGGRGVEVLRPDRIPGLFGEGVRAVREVLLV